MGPSKVGPRIYIYWCLAVRMKNCISSMCPLNDTQACALGVVLHTRHEPSSSVVHRLISDRSSVKHSPLVRLKEFPKAENELRGVKSGLLGLLTGLHKPELNITRGKCMMVSGNRSIWHGLTTGVAQT